MALILIVDDEEAIVNYIARVLKTSTHTIISAGDGKTALAMARSENPDIMVLDVNLPKMDGLEVCKILKSESKTEKLPIILMSAAYTDVADASKGTARGADEYMIKPFLREVLIHNINRLLLNTGKSDSSD